MSAKHTPGPWRLVDRGGATGTCYVCTEATNPVLSIRPMSAEGGLAFGANAALIIAAPDMLAALCDTLAAHDAGGRFDIPWGTIRAAIAKATAS